MIQFNLLPDIKLEYLKAERMRRLVVSVSILVTIAAVALLIGLFSITVLQKKHSKDLDKDISSASSQIQGHADLNKILTVQNQLKSLTGLHDTKPAVSRLASYLGQVTPTAVAINNLKVDYTQKTIDITGTADSLAAVNQYVDTLKFTKYCLAKDDQATVCDATVTDSNTGKQKPLDCADPKNNDNTDCKAAFSSVVLTTFGLTEHEADYEVTLAYDPAIFDITKNIKLTVPNTVTTRSELEQPDDLFKLPIDNPSGSKR